MSAHGLRPHSSRARSSRPCQKDDLPTVAIPPPLRSTSVTAYARQFPWLLDVPIHGERFGDVLEQQPRFAITGSGPLSARTITPETQAARELADGPLGPRLDRALRGWLATNDAFSGATELTGVALSTSPTGTAVNVLLGELLIDGYGAELPPRTPSPGLPASLARYLETHPTVQHEGFTAYSTPYLVFNHTASSALLDLVDNGTLDKPQRNTGISAKRQGDYVGSLMVHELQHRSTPPMLGSDDPDSHLLTPRDHSRREFAEEGAADLIANLPGVTGPAMERMGFAYGGSRLFNDGYEPLVLGWRHILAAGGMDPDDPTQSGRIHTLIQSAPTSDDALLAAADAIVAHHKLPTGAIEVVRKAVRAIGESGIGSRDLIQAEARREHIEHASAALHALVESLKADAR